MKYLLAILAVVLLGTQYPTSWTYYQVDDPNGATVLTDINEVDRITGYTTLNGVTTAVMTDCLDGCVGWHNIGYPGQESTVATGLDVSSDSTGYYGNQNNTTGYVKQKIGGFTALPSSGSALYGVMHPLCADLKAWACHGQSHKFPPKAVGYQTIKHGTINAVQAMEYDIDTKVITPIIIPGAISSVATSINGHLNIVGFESVSTGHSITTQGWFLRYGVLYHVNYPGASSTTAWGVNWQGDVVGSYTDSSANSHGFVYYQASNKAAHFVPIDYPGAKSTVVRSINGHNLIVGSYVDSAGATHGFLGLPQ